MAVRAAGTFLVSLGRPHMIPMVSATRANIFQSGAPLSHAVSPSTVVLNIPNWDKKITMARPLTKPIITGCGINLTNFPSRSSPAAICMPPTISRVMNSQCSPKLSTGVARPDPISFPFCMRCTMTTAMAPVAPDIIPGRPPAMEVTIPIIKAPYNPTKGSTPATKAKATASGTKARATVSPERISSLGLKVKFRRSSFLIALLKRGQS